MQQRTNMADCRHLKHLCMPFYECLLRTPCVLSAIELLRKISKATPARWHIIQKGNSMTSWYSVLLPSLSSPACTVQCADAKTNCYHGMQQITMSADAYCEAGERHSSGILRACPMSGNMIHIAILTLYDIVKRHAPRLKYTQTSKCTV